MRPPVSPAAQAGQLAAAADALVPAAMGLTWPNANPRSMRL
jgi:hypothetical protein